MTNRSAITRVELGRLEDHALVRSLASRLTEEGWNTLAVIHDDALHREVGGGFTVRDVERSYPRFATWARRARARGERIAVILRERTDAPRLVRVAA